jgi:hypothetical protein
VNGAFSYFRSNPDAQRRYAVKMKCRFLAWHSWHCLHGLFLAPKGDQILWICLRVVVCDIDGRVAHVVDRGIVQDMVGRVTQLWRYCIRFAKTIFPDAGRTHRLARKRTIETMCTELTTRYRPRHTAARTRLGRCKGDWPNRTRTRPCRMPWRFFRKTID